MTTIMTMCPGDHLDDENYDEYDDDDEYDDEDEYVDDINTLTPPVLWLHHQQRGGLCPRTEKFLLVSKNLVAIAIAIAIPTAIAIAIASSWSDDYVGD